jgi:uncharacterized protein (DUF1501 family)
MDPIRERQLMLNRRQLLRGSMGVLGSAALVDLLGPQALAGNLAAGRASQAQLQTLHHPARAKRIIYLFMSGAPSQFETWDYKPKLRDMFDEDLPDSVVKGQRFTTMTSGQERFPIAPSIYDFAQHGESGTWVSEVLPHTAKVVDDLTVVRSVFTEAINHDPAITFIQTGSELPGRPSLGAWLSYGLGSANSDLPTFMVLHSSWTGRKEAQALYSRLWGAGFLPSKHQGVSLRAQDDPVLYLSNPDGVDAATRRRLLDSLNELNEHEFDAIGDPEIKTRIAQYEMAYRMQTSVPELFDLSSESASTRALYGPEVEQPGTFAANCLLARRMVERDVRCVQIFIRGWDQHGNLPVDLKAQCNDVDQASAGLIQDLKQRGMLDDTIVVWGGEFGRTTYCQGALTKENYGRDHHPRCFSMWMAGGGFKGGYVHGETDDFSYNIVDKPVHIHDLNATLLHCLGVDHKRLTHLYQGRDFRLTDVHGEVVSELLA